MTRSKTFRNQAFGRCAPGFAKLDLAILERAIAGRAETGAIG